MPLSGKKCLFIVQGDGRGHMTQAISAKQILEKAGIKVCEVIVGESKHRHVPQFFYEGIDTKITVIKSFGLVCDGKQKAVKPLRTFIKNTLLFAKYIKSVKTINERIIENKPDIIINFFEPLCGIYSILFKPSVPIVCIAHHYTFLHGLFKMPAKKPLSNFSLRLYSRITAIGSKKKLAISLYPFENDLLKSIHIIPPLLRSEVTNHKTTKGEYLLVYLLNKGYTDEIINWSKLNPGIELHCFTDDSSIGDTRKHNNSLTFHYLNGEKFIDMMANAGGVITTAGFESVCEAMYFNKPVFMIPVKGHHEQFCNSRDAVKAGAGIFDDNFNISKFLDYIPSHKKKVGNFRLWVNQADALILLHIKNTISGEDIRLTDFNPKLWANYPDKAV